MVTGGGERGGDTGHRPPVTLHGGQERASGDAEEWVCGNQNRTRVLYGLLQD